MAIRSDARRQGHRGRRIASSLIYPSMLLSAVLPGCSTSRSLHWAEVAQTPPAGSPQPVYAYVGRTRIEPTPVATPVSTPVPTVAVAPSVASAPALAATDVGVQKTAAPAAVPVALAPVVPVAPAPEAPAPAAPALAATPAATDVGVQKTAAPAPAPAAPAPAPAPAAPAPALETPAAAAPAPAPAAPAPVPAAPAPVPAAPVALAASAPAASAPAASVSAPSTVDGLTSPPPSVIPAPSSEYPIDLTTALRLAEVENPLIAEARQRIGEAVAFQQRARALLLPDINAGTNYHYHQGNLQRSSGRILKLDEQSLYFGGGADVVAAGTVEVPAISIVSALTEAIFEPLAARQQVVGARFQAAATANQVLLEVADLHFELLAREADLRVRRETAAQGSEVARLTRSYAEAQEGRSADAERAATELALIDREVLDAEEGVAVASARLARRLHLDQSVRVRPIAPIVEEVTLVDPNAPVIGLIQTALRRRPEVGARAATIGAAETRYREERYRPLLPTLSLGFSGGAFGGGSNLTGVELGAFRGRTDFDVLVFWTLRNFGAGNLSLQKQRQAQVGQAVGEQSRAIAEIRSEVSAAAAEVAAARQRVSIATRQLASAETGFREDLIYIRTTVGRPIELVNSLRLLNQARVDRIRAVTDYNQAQVRLFVALGSPPPLNASPNTPLPPAPIASPLLPPVSQVHLH